MNDFIAIHIRPWLVVARDLLPHRPICKSNHKMEPAMNILGLTISVDPAPKARWTRRVAALGTAIGITAVGGVAYAFWTTAGTGAATAQARSFTALTVSAGTAPAGQLYPGLTADGSTVGGDLVLSVTNSNPFPVQITGVQAGTGAITVTNALGGANSTCAASTGVSIITKSSPTVVYQTGTSVPANQATAFTVTIKNVVSMSTASVTECQGATFTFPSTGVSLNYTSA